MVLYSFFNTHLVVSQLPYCICIDKYGCSRFKDEWSCSRLIAESLDPDGKVSAAQVSNKLRQLGLQVAPKKRVRYSGEPSTVGLDQHGEDRCKIETNNALHNSNDLEGSSLRHPL